MKCPKCEGSTRVLETRDVRRRRACEACDYRFFTHEVVAGASVMGRPRTRPVAPLVTPEEAVEIGRKRTEARRKIEDIKERKRAARDVWSEDNDFIPEKW